MPETKVVNPRGLAVAKDALKWLPRANLAFENGYIVGIVPVDCVVGDVKDHADDIIAHCQLCALGAALVALARIEDDLPMDRLFNKKDGFSRGVYNHCVLRLGAVFGDSTVDEIERAFEGNTWAGSGYAGEFGRNFDDPCDRAIAVFEEIVRQGGNFDPMEAVAHYDRTHAAVINQRTEEPQ